MINYTCRFWAFTNKSFGIIVLNKDGQVQFDTGNISRYLRCYFDHTYAKKGRTLPPPLLEWLNAGDAGPTSESSPSSGVLCLCHAGMRLVVTLLEDDNGARTLLFAEQRLMFLPEELAKVGLTQRESEIFFWMSEGKSYGVIATILGVSARTIGNHAQSIFKKLDVSTRAEALLSVLEKLGRNRYVPLHGASVAGQAVSCLDCPRLGLVTAGEGGPSQTPDGPAPDSKRAASIQAKRSRQLVESAG